MTEEPPKPPCYQIIIQVYNQPVSVFTFKTHLEANSFLEQNILPGQNPIIQYVEHLDYPIPQMEMPPRPQDMEPFPVVLPASNEDAQKLKAYLDGD